jgi:hypothetical protein
VPVRYSIDFRHKDYLKPKLALILKSTSEVTCYYQSYRALTYEIICQEAGRDAISSFLHDNCEETAGGKGKMACKLPSEIPSSKPKSPHAQMELEHFPTVSDGGTQTKTKTKRHRHQHKGTNAQAEREAEKDAEKEAGPGIDTHTKTLAGVAGERCVGQGAGRRVDHE